MRKFMRFALYMIVILLMISNYSFTYAEEPPEMPYVILGGFTCILDYTEEAFVIGPEVSNPDPIDVTAPSYNIVQVGDVPILCKSDLVTAFARYLGQTVEIKQIYDGKLYTHLEEIDYYSEYFDYFKSYSSISGKVSFLVPELNLAFAFGHPVSNGRIYGTAYSATVNGMDDEGYFINSSKEENEQGEKNIFAVATNQNMYGVVLSYTPSRINTEDYTLIQLARKDEVELGTAYIYTDFGDGLNLYEIEITSLVDEDLYNMGSDFNVYGLSIDESPITSARFEYIFTDERLREANITDSAPGMSGSPIIQNDKLIGINAFSYGERSAGVYAQYAYESMIESTIETEEVYDHPKVILGKAFCLLYTKPFGICIESISQNEFGLNDGDLIVAIDDKTIFTGTTLSNILNDLNTGTRASIKLTILRDNGELEDVYINNGANIEATNYNNIYMMYGYVSMIDPNSYRYAVGTMRGIHNYASIISGVSIKSPLSLSYNSIPTSSMGHDVVGTIDGYGYQLYGFYEPFNYRNDLLIEVALKDDIEDGEALLYINIDSYVPLMKTITVNVVKEDDYLRVSLPDNSFVRDLSFISVNGVPIVQNGRIIGVYAFIDPEDTNSAYAYYAIDVYTEMMNTN